MVSLSEGERRAIRRRRRAQGFMGHLGTVLQFAGSVALAVGLTVPLVFFVGIALAFSGAIYAVVRGPHYARIIEEHRVFEERAAARSRSLATLLDSALRALMSDLNIDFSQSRISVYRYRDNSFILLDRVSHSQILERAGRARYPSDEGVIGRIWDLREAVVTRLPADRESWNDRCVEDFGMARDVVTDLSMQSRSFVGRRIDVVGPTERPVGLILLESLAPQGVNGTTMDALTMAPNYNLLSHILQEVIQCLDEQDVAHFRESRSA